jgi:hypothetical protein
VGELGAGAGVHHLNQQVRERPIAAGCSKYGFGL